MVTGRLKRIPFETHRLLALLGFFLFGLNFFLFYKSASYMATAIGSIIFTIAAIFNALNQWLFFGKSPERKVIVGSLLGTLGVLCLSSDQLASSGDQTWIGILLALLATLHFLNWKCDFDKNYRVRHRPAQHCVPRHGVGNSRRGRCGNGDRTKLCHPNRAVLLGRPSLAFYWRICHRISLLSDACQPLGAAKAAYVTVGVPPISLALSTLFENYQWHWIAAVGMAFILLGSFLVFAPGVRVGGLRSSRVASRAT